MSNDLVERLRFKAQVAYGFNASYGRKGKDWAIETEIEWQAADHIEAQDKLIEEMREALQSAKEELYQISHSGGDPDDEGNMDSYASTYRECKHALSKAKSQQEGETE